MAVYPNTDCLNFCYWMLNVSWQRLSPPRINVITTVYNAAIAQTSVSDNEWNNFTQITSWRLPYYRAYSVLSVVNNFYVQNYLSSWSVQPSNAYISALNTLVDSLIASNDWYYLYDMWIFATPSSDGSLISLVNPTNTPLVPVNAPSFTANQGYAGNGSSSYIQTPFIPANYTAFPIQNNVQMGCYLRNNVDENKYHFGVRDGSSFTSFRARVSGFAYALLNSSATANYSNTDSRGLHIISRADASNLSYYKNGALVNTVSNSSVSPSTRPVYVLCSNENGTPSLFSTNQMSMFFIARSGLNPVSFYSAFQTFATTVGFNV